MQNGVAATEKSIEGFFKYLQIQLSYDPANLFLSIYPKEMRTIQRHIYKSIVHSSTIYQSQRWKQFKYSLTDQRTNIVCHKHTMDCYLALNVKKILIYATTWINLEDIMLSEINQKQNRNAV